jgi:hypothetical protein
MRDSYIDELNNLYNTRVFLRENLGDGGLQPGDGPNDIDGAAEDDEQYEPPVRACKCGKVEGEDAEECPCMNEPSEDDMVISKRPARRDYEEEGFEDEFHNTGKHPEDKASNMVKQNLYRITKMSAMLFDKIPDDDNIEPWVADKISKAVDSINSVLGYKDYEDFRRKVEGDMEIEEKTEQDLYKSIDDGGATLIQKIKDIMSTQPRQKVEDTVYGLIKMLES